MTLSLLMIKSKVFTPATKPLVIEKLANDIKGSPVSDGSGLVMPVVTPLSRMLTPELSIAQAPVREAVEGTSPVKSNVVR